MIVTKLKIRKIGDPCLREKSTPVDSVGFPEKMLIKSMIATMRSAKGIGLAAVQVGINKQIIVVDIGDGSGTLVMINPEIAEIKGQEEMEEGCLSVPNYNIKIKRAATIMVKYLDEGNCLQEGQFVGLQGRAIQHEMDHLMGKLIVDYLNEDKKK